MHQLRTARAAPKRNDRLAAATKDPQCDRLVCPSQEEHKDFFRLGRAVGMNNFKLVVVFDYGRTLTISAS